MTTKIINLQDNFLNQVRKDGIPVTIHLVNGFQIKGTVRGFDNFVLMVDAMGKQQMIYKYRPSRRHNRCGRATMRRNHVGQRCCTACGAAAFSFLSVP